MYSIFYEKLYTFEKMTKNISLNWTQGILLSTPIQYLCVNKFNGCIILVLVCWYVDLVRDNFNNTCQIFALWNKASSDKLHLAVSHCALYPIHLLAIHFEPSNTGHALWCVNISGSPFRKRLYQTNPSPLSGNIEIPAKGHTVAPPK